MKTVIIYHTDIDPKTASPDDLDVFDQVNFISDILTKLGYKSIIKPFKLEFPDKNKPTLYKSEAILNEIKSLNPEIIFNLVEVVNGKEPLNYIATEVFEKAKVPYAGCTKAAFIKVADKLTTKKFLIANKIKTPHFLTLENLKKENLNGKTFLVKSSTQHASQGLISNLYKTKEELLEVLGEKGPDFFAEEYIEGREFNISVIGKLHQPIVLPIAEMQFKDWNPKKLKIVDYAAKWDSSVPEYHNTVRNFEFKEEELILIKELQEICKDCWNVFDLRGYARIDFRVSSQGVPYVLEINANPCISPDAGFIAATEKAGLSHEQTIKKILDASLN